MTQNRDAYNRLHAEGRLPEVENLVLRGLSPQRIGFYFYGHPSDNYWRANAHIGERAARYIRDGTA